MISDERLQYILTTGNTRGKDAQEMARELIEYRENYKPKAPYNPEFDDDPSEP